MQRVPSSPFKAQTSSGKYFALFLFVPKIRFPPFLTNKIAISQEQSKNLATKTMVTLSSQNCKSVLLPSPLLPQHCPSKGKINIWYCVL